MKSSLMKMIAAFAILAAGCATNQPSTGGFRYEDRDKIAEMAARIETVSAGLQQLAMQPDSYLATKSMYMAGTYDTKAADTVRFFANEAARFHRAVVTWQPGGNIGLDYSSLVRQWDALQRASTRLKSSEQMRVKIGTLNELMISLGRVANSGGAGPAPAPRP